MSWIGAIVIGFLAGLVARALSSDPRNPQGCLLTTFIGILGAALFTWIGQQIGLYGEGDRAGLLGAIVGALIVLGLWRAISGNK